MSLQSDARFRPYQIGAVALGCVLAMLVGGCAHFTRPETAPDRAEAVVKAPDAAQVQGAAVQLFLAAGYSLVSREPQTVVLDREVEGKGQSLFTQDEARSALTQRVRLRVVSEEPGVFRVTASAVVITNRTDMSIQDAPVSGRSGEELQRILKQLPKVIR